MSLAARLRPTGRWLLVAIVCAFAIVPFLYIVSTSLKDSRTLFSYPPEWVPWPLYSGNYSKLFDTYPALRWLFNSVFVASAVTAIKLVIDSMAGYAFSKLEFVGRRPFFVLMLATVMIPPVVLLIPLFFIVRDLHWLDTYWALILPPLANPLGIFMVGAFVRGLPSELIEAARVDNASEWRIYRSLVLPAIKPGLVVLATYTFLLQYTNFIWPLVVTSDSHMFLLTNGLATLKPLNNPDWGLISAGSILTMVPITILFFAFQRAFNAPALSDALKG
jgi:multiple sugar transport system permease protein